MAIYLVKCPSCGSATELNDEKDFGFCTECGMKILTSEAELYTEPESTPPDAPTAVPTFDGASLSSEGAGAPDGPSTDDAPSADLSASTETPAPSAPVYDGPPLTNAEQLDYLILNRPQPLDSVVFRSSDECAAYVTGLHDLICDLGARYASMNHAEEATCLDFLERGIGYCEYLDTRRLRFLAGTHEENGKVVEDYGTFPVSKTLLKEIKEVREQFISAYNGFFQPKIAAAKADLEETKEKIKALPGLMRFYHSFCTPLMGILTAALFAIGLVPILMKLEKLDLRINIPIAAVGGLLFIAWIVTTVIWILKGGSARQLYKAADRQVNEVRTYRAKLKS